MANMEALAGIVLPDSDGKDVPLGDIWREQPAVVAWLRHYG